MIFKKNKITILVALTAGSLLISSASLAESTSLSKFLQISASEVGYTSQAEALSNICKPHLEFMKSIKASTKDLLTSLKVLRSAAGTQRGIINNLAAGLLANNDWRAANKKIYHTVLLTDASIISGIPNPYYGCLNTATSGSSPIHLLTQPGVDYVAVGSQQCQGNDNSNTNETIVVGGGAEGAENPGWKINNAAGTDEYAFIQPKTDTEPYYANTDDATFVTYVMSDLTGGVGPDPSADGAFNGITVHPYHDGALAKPFTMYKSDYACPAPSLDFNGSTGMDNQQGTESDSPTIYNINTAMCFKGVAGSAESFLRNQNGSLVQFTGDDKSCSSNCHWFCAGGDGADVDDNSKGDCTVPNRSGNTSTTIVYSQTIRSLSSEGVIGKNGVDLLVPTTAVNCHSANDQNTSSCVISFMTFQAVGNVDTGGKYGTTGETLDTGISAANLLAPMGTAAAFDSTLLEGDCLELLTDL